MATNLESQNLLGLGFRRFQRWVVAEQAVEAQTLEVCLVFAKVFDQPSLGLEERDPCFDHRLATHSDRR